MKENNCKSIKFIDSFDELPIPSIDTLGFSYILTNTDITTSNFIMGSGKFITDGCRIIVIEVFDEESNSVTYKFDVLYNIFSDFLYKFFN